MPPDIHGLYSHLNYGSSTTKRWCMPDGETHLTASPTTAPSLSPSPIPTTKSPSMQPTRPPTAIPSKRPTGKPLTEAERQELQTLPPTSAPSRHPSNSPTPGPTACPTKEPSKKPSQKPTAKPTEKPTKEGATRSPTRNPTPRPTLSPTKFPSVPPTVTPSDLPTVSPTPLPTNHPTVSPTRFPTTQPTLLPTKYPTGTPTFAPEPCECGAFCIQRTKVVSVGDNVVHREPHDSGQRAEVTEVSPDPADRSKYRAYVRYAQDGKSEWVSFSLLGFAGVCELDLISCSDPGMLPPACPYDRSSRNTTFLQLEFELRMSLEQCTSRVGELLGAVGENLSVYTGNMDVTCTGSDHPTVSQARRRLHQPDGSQFEGGSRGLSKRYPTWSDNVHNGPDAIFPTDQLKWLKEYEYDERKKQEKIDDGPRIILRVTIYAPADVCDTLFNVLKEPEFQRSMWIAIQEAWGGQRSLAVKNFNAFSVVPDPDLQCQCTAVFWPVCGHDGRSYANTCISRCAGVIVQHNGACYPCIRTDGDVVISTWRGLDNGPNWCNTCACIDGSLGCSRNKCSGPRPPDHTDAPSAPPTSMPTKHPGTTPTWGSEVGFGWDDVPFPEPVDKIPQYEYDGYTEDDSYLGLDRVANMMAWTLVAFPALLAGRRMRNGF